MNEVKKTQQLLTEIIDFIKETPWKADYLAQVERYYDLAERPCVLAIAGQVKAGKSSFLNSLLGLDLAAVGTTETTATINIFKYGKVKDPQKPVIVYWNDGREPEAQTKEFIDSLQGYTDDVLEKAEKIDHLEYIIEDERFEEITLVDTPGFASIIDEHEQCTADFFNPRREKLRNKQSEKSGVLTESADAVIFMSGPVAKKNAQKFFGERIPHISPFNAIGVMGKIDMIQPTPAIQMNKWDTIEKTLSEANDLSSHLAKVFEHELHTVLPVSASLYQAIMQLNKNGEAEKLQKRLKLIPKDKFDRRFDLNSAHWESSEGPYQEFFKSCGLSLEMRIGMVGNIPWMVFCVIAIALYYLPLSEAIAYLVKFSGMEAVKSTLEERFFKRSRSIRCMRVLKDVQQVLVYIRNMELPKKRSEVNSKSDFLNVIKQARGGLYDDDLLDAFTTFVEKNISDDDDLDRFSREIDSLLIKTDQLLGTMEGVETLNEGLILLRQVQQLFAVDEIEELEALLGENSGRIQDYTLEYCNQRQMKWRAKMQRMRGNTDVSHLLSIVCNCYGKLCNN